MASVTFDKATRLYPGSTRPAVDALDLQVADGEFLVLVGPSGCGKSTSLRMLAGLEEVNEGNILIGDRNVTDVPPKDRDIAMVFQNYALYPHMTVAENMGFALKIAGINKDERAKRVLEAAKLLDLEPYLARKPKALSGGQRQRVAMGRAIVRSPQVFLMDEPLSNLDAKLRVQTRTQIASLTADLVEGGLKFGSSVAQLDRSTMAATSANKVTIGVRPEDVVVAKTGDGLKVDVDLVEELGADGYLYGHTDIDGSRVDIVARVDGRVHPSAGEQVVITPKASHIHAFDIESGERLSKAVTD
jgi:multiple sugar transport system ATP-binding protein